MHEYYDLETKEETLKLQPFENAIREIGMLSYRAEVLDKTGSESTDVVIKVFNKLSEVLGIDMRIDAQNNKEFKENAVEEVKLKIRSILGIEELTTIRRILIEKAISFLKEDL